ncbi:unnamed protein product [marine sediment metagenome]|uniref:Uncharacterized protein n=1 Tax=marine sediment metagenome TaxID=412755 RepID=X1DW42_9ZZZZ
MEIDHTLPNLISMASYGHFSLHIKHILHSPFPVKKSNGSSNIRICFGQTSSQTPHSDRPTHFTGFRASFKKEYSDTAEEIAANGHTYLQYILGYQTDNIIIKE